MENQSISGVDEALQEENIKKKFGQKLTKLRKKANMTRADLAALIGVSPVTVGAYENGGREPSFAKMLALADVFKVPLDYLFGRIGCGEDFLLAASVKYRYDKSVRKILISGATVEETTDGLITINFSKSNLMLDKNGLLSSPLNDDVKKIYFANEHSLATFVFFVEQLALIKDKSFRTIFIEEFERIWGEQKSFRDKKKINAEELTKADLEEIQEVQMEKNFPDWQNNIKILLTE